jgi:hypothetical protein
VIERRAKGPARAMHLPRGPHRRNSAYGHERRFRDVRVTSAYAPRAATKRTWKQFTFVPKPALSNRSKTATYSARPSSGSGMVRPSVLAILRLMTSSTFAQSLPERSKSPRTPKPQHPFSAMSYCHMSFDWCSEAIANAVGGKCISYVGGNLCLCLLIQASNCCCDRGC